MFNIRLIRLESYICVVYVFVTVIRTVYDHGTSTIPIDIKD